MPMYTYSCSNDECNGVDYLVSHMNEHRPTWKRCSLCGKRAHRTYEAPQLAIFHPYVTPDITGSEVEVTSPRQEDELCRRHGVTRLLSTEMTGSRSEIKKKRAGRWKEAIENLGNFEEQYQKNTAVSVQSGD